MSHSLIVLPEDSARPVLDAINLSTRSLRIKMFVFSDPEERAHLIWCPTNGRNRLARFIDNADHHLFVQNERYQDPIIIERLVRAARRGVSVHVMARLPHTLKDDKLMEGVGGLRILDDVGIKVHKLRHLKLHAKMMLADGVRGIVGSINLAPGSFDSRRELAIEVRDDDVADRLHQVAHQDWENSLPLDLSDEGLLADLEDRYADSAEKLALHGDHAEDKHKKQ
jgi:phosphatidylserine/phosphatidylglycerophosphate/cardiolipin synthase-like enzyme